MIKSSENYELKREKQGRRKIADLVTFKDGRKAYMKLFSQSEFYRDGEKSLSKALRNEQCYLWMESHKLMELMFSGVEYVGFEERYTGDVYLTRLSTFRSPTTSKQVRIGARDVRAVVLKHFRVRKGDKKLKLPIQM